MIAQHNQPEDQLPTQPVDEQPDPIGPITLPMRGRVGTRALALVGAAGIFAVGIVGLADTCGGWPTTISA